MIRYVKSSLLLVLAILFSGNGYVRAQSNDQMVSMIKNMLVQFGEMQSEETASDQVMDAGTFDPSVKLNDPSAYKGGLGELEQMMSLSEYENGYTIVDDKEFPTNSIKLVFDYTSLPAFTELNAWYELESVKDGKGKNLLMSDKEIQKYTDLGIIGDDFNYPVPGEFSYKEWLNREIDYGEPLAFKGTLYLDYPSDYEQITFTPGDAGAEKSIGSTTITLIAIDRDMVTYLVKGNRREMDGLDPVILNKDGKLFTSTSSMAIDAEMFDIEANALKDLSDEDIARSVEAFDMAAMEAEQVKKVKVYGNIGQVVFLKVNTTGQMKIPFDVILEYDGY